MAAVYTETDYCAERLVPGQDTLRSVTEFSLTEYKDTLYNKDGSPRTEGGVAADFEAKINNLMKKVLDVVEG